MFNLNNILYAISLIEIKLLEVLNIYTYRIKDKKLK